MGILGYDTRKQKYTGVWVDNYGTYLSPYEGTCENGKCTYTMPTIGPDGKPTECTMLYEIINDTSRTFAMSSPGKDGKMMTMMEITYTRM